MHYLIQETRSNPGLGRSWRKELQPTLSILALKTYEQIEPKIESMELVQKSWTWLHNQHFHTPSFFLANTFLLTQISTWVIHICKYRFMHIPTIKAAVYRYRHKISVFSDMYLLYYLSVHFISFLFFRSTILKSKVGIDDVTLFFVYVLNILCLVGNVCQRRTY